MSTAPHLSAEEIVVELRRIFANRRRSLMAALFGAGEACEVKCDGNTFPVIPTRCELELRSQLPEQPRRDQPIVFLIDWAEELPLDIRGRLAGGKLYRPSPDSRLAARFGATAAEPGLAQSVLARAVLAGNLPELKGSATSQLLRRPELFGWAVAGLVGLQIDDPPTLEALLLWVVDRSADGPAWRRRCDQQWLGLRQELSEFMEAIYGPIGRLLWKIWGQGGGLRLLEVLLMVEPMLAEWGRGSYGEGLLRGRLPELAAGYHEDLLGMISLLRDDELLERLLTAALGEREEMLRQAMLSVDKLAADPALRQALAGSRWLAAGLEARKLAFATAIEKLLESPTPEALATAVAAGQEIDAHRVPGSEAERRARLYITRLAAYLVYRHTEQTEQVTGAVSHLDAARLARDYCKNGGWVDLARYKLRGWPDPLGDTGQTVLAAVDQLRRQDDRCFARALVAWIEAGQPANQVLPISLLSRKLVKDFLKERETRKLLVLLMDGMSWANAVELVPTLLEHFGHWQLASWHPQGHRSAADPLLPPVLTAMPSLTSISRAAFFAGREKRAHGNEATDKDRERWAANSAVTAIIGKDPEQAPVLLLKRRLLKSDGSLQDDVKSMMVSDRRVLAVVVNAIDEHLNGSAQMLTEVTGETIRPLRELLLYAEETRRAVLMVSDHGHIPGNAMVAGSRAGGGRRWRPLKGDEQAGEAEIELPADRCWRSAKGRAIAAAVDEQLCYGQPGGGAHGGASLAEVVAPALLLVPDQLHEEQLDDPALAQVVFPQPEWWSYLRVSPTAPPVSEPAAEEPQPRQLSFLHDEKPEAEPRPVKAAAGQPVVVQALSKSAVFRASTAERPKEQVATALHWLTVLVEHGWQMSEAELARELGVTEPRVGGLISRMGELLNLDGYEVVERQIEGRQVRINRELLRQLFELKDLS
jgi:hypothetical protein